MQEFIQTVHCTSRAHCKTCRNFGGGRGWRTSLSKLFNLPNNKVDFECPFGKPWDNVQSATQAATQDTATQAAQLSQLMKEIEAAQVKHQVSISQRDSGSRNSIAAVPRKKGCGCSRK